MTFWSHYGFYPRYQTQVLPAMEHQEILEGFEMLLSQHHKWLREPLSNLESHGKIQKNQALWLWLKFYYFAEAKMRAPSLNITRHTLFHAPNTMLTCYCIALSFPSCVSLQQYLFHPLLLFSMGMSCVFATKFQKLFDHLDASTMQHHHHFPVIPTLLFLF